MDFYELEFKFKADNIKLSDFLAFMEKIGYDRKIDVSGWDTYYLHKTDKDCFMRFREGDLSELTIKRKVKSENNWSRVEIDLPLNPEKATRELVTQWVGLEDYELNFRINKFCSIFWTKDVNFVYYLVYDENMNEKGRFIEVEFEKSKVAEVGVEKAVESLKQWEAKLSELGISPQNRMKKSLFELYVKLGDK